LKLDPWRPNHDRLSSSTPFWTHDAAKGLNRAWRLPRVPPRRYLFRAVTQPSDPDRPDPEPPDDTTLGGYFRVHDRPPAFEGSDGHPYTVSIEVERTADLRTPYQGFLVFPRWALTGVGIVGHLETPSLWRGANREEILAQAGVASLYQVQAWLEEAIARLDIPSHT
jgi:hypothetical protein